MLRISGTRRPGCRELSWRKLVQCQLKFSWTMGQSSGGTKTMFEAVKMTPSMTPSMTPVALPESDATPPTPGVSDQLEVPKYPPAAPTQTPMKTSPLVTCPVRKSARPGYLTDNLCELSDYITGTVVEKDDK